MIVLVIKIELKPGKKEDFLAFAKPLVEGSKKEAGNIEYNLYQELDEENTVAFIEKWKDEAALEVHHTMPHFTENIGKLKNFCKSPPISNRFDLI